MATTRKKASKSTRALARSPIAQAALCAIAEGCPPTAAMYGSCSGAPARATPYFGPSTRGWLPRGYARTLHDIKERIGNLRLWTAIAANSAAILLYWEIGKIVAARLEAERWGAKVIDRLAADLRTT